MSFIVFRRVLESVQSCTMQLPVPSYRANAGTHEDMLVIPPESALPDSTHDPELKLPKRASLVIMISANVLLQVRFTSYGADATLIHYRYLSLSLFLLPTSTLFILEEHLHSLASSSACLPCSQDLLSYLLPNMTKVCSPFSKSIV